MVNEREKGNKSEREAQDIYERAGFDMVDRVGSTAGGRRMTDAFGHVDIIAMWPGRRIRFAQVKTNTGGGVGEFVQWAAAFLPPKHAAGDFLIRHDGHGGPNAQDAMWRLQRPFRKGDDVTYRTLVDERKDGVPADGAGVVEWLEKEVRVVDGG